MVVKTSVSITEAQAAFARKLVEEGRHASVSSVVQAGLEAHRRDCEREARERAEEAAFLAMLEERTKGPFLSEDEFEKGLDEMLEAEFDRLEAEEDARGDSAA